MGPCYVDFEEDQKCAETFDGWVDVVVVAVETIEEEVTVYLSHPLSAIIEHDDCADRVWEERGESYLWLH